MINFKIVVGALGLWTVCSIFLVVPLFTNTPVVAKKIVAPSAASQQEARAHFASLKLKIATLSDQEIYTELRTLHDLDLMPEGFELLILKYGADMDYAQIKAKDEWLRVFDRPAIPTRLRVVAGSMITKLAAADEPNMARMQYVESGCALMDHAVAANPDDIEGHMLRLYNGIALPVFFSRSEVVNPDIKWLLSQYKSQKIDAESVRDVRDYIASSEPATRSAFAAVLRELNGVLQ